jgi:cysteine-rich repeat protein
VLPIGDLSINPTDGPDQRDTNVTITGQALTALITIDFGNPSQSLVDPRMSAQIGTTKLKDVRLVSKNTLTGVVPLGIPQGIYPLTVTDGLQRPVTRNTAYRVRETQCTDFTDASGGYCTTCNGLDGCHCTDHMSCNAQCGDGYVRDGEECDDGNTVSGDGCDANCNVETGYTCTSTIAKRSICMHAAIAIPRRSRLG